MVSNVFSVLRNLKSEEVMGCPFDIIDEIIDDQVIVDHSRSYICNLVLSDMLKDIGLRLRFTHLSDSERKTLFTNECCEKVVNYIASCQAERFYNDRIAIDILSNDMLGKLDCKVYFKGVELFTE